MANWYKRHIGDYMKDAGHLSLLEHGVYSRLLDVYYSREAPIPDDQAARLIGARSKEEREALAYVLQEFFTLVDGAWQQARCGRELVAMVSKAELNRAVGARGGRPKKEPKPPPKMAVSETQMVSEKNPDETQMVSENDSARVKKETQAISQKPRLQDYSLPSSLSSTQRAARGDDEIPPDVSVWVEVFEVDHGVLVDHRSVHDRSKFWPLAAGWIAAGVSVGQMRRACGKARSEATEPIAYLPAYADRVLASMVARPTASAGVPAKSFAQQDREAGWVRWELATGRQHPDRLAAGALDAAAVPVCEVLDVLPDGASAVVPAAGAGREISTVRIAP